MLCKKCKSMIVLNAISFGKCENCNKNVYCGHITCYKLCDECAKKSNLCKQCGKCVDYISNNETYSLCKNYDCKKYGKCCLSEKMIDEGVYAPYDI